MTQDDEPNAHAHDEGEQDGEHSCHCEGGNPDWDYHHPTGCGATAQAFLMVSEVGVSSAQEEPIL